MSRTPPEIKVGDIIGFSGYGWKSVLINVCSYGIPWWNLSHIGIIGEYEGELLLFESTTLSNLPCVIQGKSFQGTQACRLNDRVAAYLGSAWHYPLYRSLFGAEADRLNKFLIEHLGIQYDHIGAIRSGGAAWSWLESHLHSENLDSIFCSEYCAAAHRDIGLIQTDHVSRWNPNRFVRHERGEKILVKPWRLKYEATPLCPSTDGLPDGV
jgi:hypothetical protein